MSSEWLLHAASDVALAIAGQKEKGVLPHQICFHAQQAAEKALKAVLLHHKIEFPLTHDLTQLLGLLEEAGIPVPPDFSAVDTLTPYAVETRYPGSLTAIRKEDVDTAILLAQKVLSWAEHDVGRSLRVV